MGNPRSRATKVYVQRLTVNVCLVPFDMMRYDNCVPATEIEAHKLERVANGTEVIGDRTVEFRRFSMNDAPPTVDRWKSFGCQVVSWSREG